MLQLKGQGYGFSISQGWCCFYCFVWRTGNRRDLVKNGGEVLIGRCCALIALSLFISGCVANQGTIDAGAPQHVQEALRYVGKGNPTGFKGPWCRKFLNMVLVNSGHHLADTSLMARDAVNLGIHINGPQPGAIFVLPHHTGFVIKPLGNDEFLAVSGNSGNRVRVSTYRTAGIKFVIPE